MTPASPVVLLLHNPQTSYCCLIERNLTGYIWDTFPRTDWSLWQSDHKQLWPGSSKICTMYVQCAWVSVQPLLCVSADVYTGTAVSRRPGQSERKRISIKTHKIREKKKVSSRAFFKHLVMCTCSSLGLRVQLQLCGPSAAITQCWPHRLNSLAVWSD